MDEQVAMRNDPRATSGPPSFERFGGNAAENYERFFVPAIAAPLAADLIEAAALAGGERVLDLACGTGIVARLAAERVGPTGAVAGLDLNPGMLAVARSVEPPGAAIEWHQSDAEHAPFLDNAYDAALCQMGLQFFTDKSVALGEVRRVLAPGGRVVANVPGPTPRIFAILEETLRDRVTAETAKFVSTVFSLYDSHELKALFDGAGFDDISVGSRRRSLRLATPTEFLWQYLSSTPLATAVAGLDEHERLSLESAIASEWEPFTNEGALVLELDVVTVKAHRR